MHSLRTKVTLLTVCSIVITAITSALVWFTVPKDTGKPIWLPPYITDNLGMRVISYNIPIYWRETFIGVVGIEIDCTTMAEQVESIRLYNNGYAFLNSAEGELFFHPRIDVALLTEETAPEIPEGMHSESTFIRYTFDGVEKQAAWLPLSNGMHLTVTAPVSEAEGDWRELIWEIVAVSALVLLALSALTMYYSRRITMPLEELTWAAERVDAGDYGFTLKYDGDDEVGRLTSTFKRLADHMRDNLSELNRRVYVDALTSVKNKGAFISAIEDLQLQINETGSRPAFAVGVFDCDELKQVNDRYGHEKGDLYLKNACRLICRVFRNSPVFRIGGDEFAVLLQNEDYNDLPALVSAFDRATEESLASAVDRWEQVHVTMGVAVYDPQLDQTALDAVHRADRAMYANKRLRKGETTV